MLSNHAFDLTQSLVLRCWGWRPWTSWRRLEVVGKWQGESWNTAVRTRSWSESLDSVRWIGNKNSWIVVSDFFPSWFLDHIGKTENVHTWPGLFGPGCHRKGFSQETEEQLAGLSKNDQVYWFCQKNLHRVSYERHFKTPASGESVGLQKGRTGALVPCKCV